MNIRFSGPHVRFRISESEREQLLQAGYVEDKTPLPRGDFGYRITLGRDARLEELPERGLCLFVDRERIESLQSPKGKQWGTTFDLSLSAGRSVVVSLEIDILSRRKKGETQ